MKKNKTNLRNSLLILFIIFISINCSKDEERPIEIQVVYENESDKLKKEVFELNEFEVELVGEEDKTYKTLVKCKMALAYLQKENHIREELSRRKEEIQETIQTMVRKKKYEDIDSAEEREMDLKKVIMSEVNQLLTSGKIVDVYFMNVIISRKPKP